MKIENDILKSNFYKFLTNEQISYLLEILKTEQKKRKMQTKKIMQGFDIE